MAKKPSFNFGANSKPKKSRSKKAKGARGKGRGKGNAWRAYVGGGQSGGWSSIPE